MWSRVGGTVRIRLPKSSHELPTFTRIDPGELRNMKPEIGEGLPAWATQILI